MTEKFDVIIIGTGAGGGTAGYQFAKAGKKVLFIERGPLFDQTTLFQDEQAMLVDRAAGDDRRFVFDGVSERPFTGGVVGGSTSLYGACLMRPGPSDFIPEKYYGHCLPDNFKEWPVGYDALEPFYTMAENIYGVTGENNAAAPFLNHRKTPYPASPLPLHETNRDLARMLTSRGLNPFVLPLGIDPDLCRQCPTCPGYFCPTPARASSYERCIKPAIENHGAILWDKTEVTSVHVKGSTIRRLCLERASETVEVQGDLVILAAGAMGSPVFLQQHDLAGQNDLVGRNFMFHLGVIFTALSLSPTGAGKNFIKQLGITDFYIGHRPEPHKLGYVQQLPMPGILSIQEQIPFKIPKKILETVLYHNITFAGAIEDLPQMGNRVVLKNGRINVSHQYHPYDVFRAKILKRKFGAVMRKIPKSLSFSFIAHREKLHTAHQVGTCRFGRNPQTSVLDPFCRVHHLDNLYVTDGSFMPSSLGVAPALTIMANALRVAHHLLT